MLYLCKCWTPFAIPRPNLYSCASLNVPTTTSVRYPRTKNKILITIRPDELFERSFRVELYDERFGATDIDIALVVFEFEIVAITDESENI